RMAGELHLGPVIEAGPPHRALVEVEAQPADQVQRGPSPHAQPADVARVGRYLRLPQRNVKHAVLAFPPMRSMRVRAPADGRKGLSCALFLHPGAVSCRTVAPGAWTLPRASCSVPGW